MPGRLFDMLASPNLVWIFARASAMRARPSTKRAGSDRAGSPLARRPPDELLESPAECSFGLVADFMRHGGNFGAGVGQALGGQLHAPLGQVLNWRTANQMGESIGQRRA